MMLNEQNKSSGLKKIWRLAEVYLFFLISVFGGQVFVKNTFFNKYNHRNAETRTLVSKSAPASLILNHSFDLHQLNTKPEKTLISHHTSSKFIHSHQSKGVFDLISTQYLIHLIHTSASGAFNLSQISPPLLI
jgi:hypothetical protein